MSAPDFFQTLMGRKFYDHDVPAIATSLGRIATALETIAARMAPVPIEASDRSVAEDGRRDGELLPNRDE